MGVLWLSGRAEYILKCNMISSLLLLFLPPWLFFTVFKGMFSYQPAPPVAVFPIMLWSRSVLTTRSPCTSPQIISPASLCVTSASWTHVPLCCLLARCSPCSRHQPPGLSSAPRFPRPSPLDAVAERCSSVCQHRCRPSCPVLSCPDPVHRDLALWAVTSQPLSALSSHRRAGLS